MLNPHDRTSLFDALKPPTGYRFDAGVGTSFSLNLEAILTAPIAFTLFDMKDSRGDGEFEGTADDTSSTVEPVGLLESVRRYAGRLTVFTQAGQIALPRSPRTVYAWFEDAIIEASASQPHRLFHPKVWLCRYRSNGDGSSVLRVLCATRNLTLDSSMDTVLVLESNPYETKGSSRITAQEPLVGFFRQLASDAGSKLSPRRRNDLLDLTADLEVTPLVPPEPFNEFDFHILGAASSGTIFPDHSDRCAVISPFVGETFLRRLHDQHRVDFLMSREAALNRISPALLKELGRVVTLHPNAGFDRTDIDSGASQDSTTNEIERESTPPGTATGGLHAKLFVFDVGSRTHVFTGSANATDAAFAGNIEVVAELRGPVRHGVKALLEDTPDEVGFDDLCIDYEPFEEIEPIDEEAEGLAYSLDWFRHAIALCDFRATVTEADDGYLIDLSSGVRLPTLDGVESIKVWPITLLEDLSAVTVPMGERLAASFSVSIEGITSFYAIRISAAVGNDKFEVGFVVNADLTGVPDDRHSKLLAAMLRDPDRLLRYLLLLLSDESDMSAEMLDAGGQSGLGSWGGGGWSDVPLLELLVKAASRFPERLDHINALLSDLGEHRSATVPKGFSSIWDPVWEYREQTRS